MKNPKARVREFGQKKEQYSLGLTPEGVAGLDDQARKLGMSRSQFVELIGRGQLSLKPVDSAILGKS